MHLASPLPFCHRPLSSPSQPTGECSHHEHRSPNLAASMIRKASLLALRINRIVRRVRYSALFFALCLALASDAQIFTITEAAITSCSGSFFDSGGQGGTGYGSNESFTSTLCPDLPGQGVVLDFQFFDLSVAGSGTIDQLAIHDGPDAAAPLIGTFTGTQLLGQQITVTPANPSGCLTLVFNSNDLGEGVFAATIACVPNCVHPIAVAVVTNEDGPALVCQSQSVDFDGSGSIAGIGTSITLYEWDFGDGTNGVGATQTHQYDEAGEYIVSLTVSSAAGCESVAPATVNVWVGPAPDFTGTTEDLTVCEGGSVDLFGVVNTSTWTGVPVVDLGGPISLPDNVNIPFSNSLDFNGFPIGSTIATADDIVSICVDIEHSYLGDIRLEMECPNGQVVVLKSYPGGGGTFLGDANDTEPIGTPAVPGSCWQYCFAPNAPFGTMVDCSQFGPTPNVIPSSQGTALAPGTYTSSQPLSGFAGCPLNGEWTLTFTDNLLADNGVICGWSIQFDGSFYSELTTLAPTFGTTADSMNWTGAGVTLDPADPSHGVFTSQEPGVYDLTFSATNNFGCAYDTTITVTVTPAPVVEATSTLGNTCSDPAQLHAEIVAFPPPALPCDWTLELYDSFGDGWNGGANLQFVINGISTTYSMPPGGNNSTITISVPVGATLALIYTAGTLWNAENAFELVNYAGNILYDSPVNPPGGTLWNGIGDCGTVIGPMTWQWTPGAGVDTPDAPDALAQITQPTEFVIRAFPTGQPWCFTTDTVLASPPSFLENDSEVVNAACNGVNGAITLITTGPGGPWSYVWIDATGTIVRNTASSNGDVLAGPAGSYTAFIAEGPQGNGCLDTLTATITQPDAVTWSITTSDTLICLTGQALIAAEAQGGTGPITLQWNQGLVGPGPHSVSPPDTTVYTVLATDANGCNAPLDSITVFTNAPLSFTPLLPDTECVGLPVTFTAANASGGNGEYTFDWGPGPQLDSSYTFLLPWSNYVTVTLRDGCETPPFTSYTWLEILHTPAFVVTADTTLGCAPFAVQLTLLDTTDQAEVLWSYGDGSTLTAADSVTHTYATAGNFDVSTQVTWPNGCVTDTTLVDLVRVISVPIADMTWNPRPANINEPTVRFQDLSLPSPTSWLWDLGDELGTSQEQNPVFEFPNAVGGSYPVLFVVSNFLGCTDTLRSVVEVEDEFLVWVPNAFTPDGNPHNQTFFVSGNDISSEDFEFVIFDRWGGEVFRSTDRYEVWDGTKDGSLLPQGVYVWRLEVRSLSTRDKRTLMGHVNLLH